MAGGVLGFAIMIALAIAVAAGAGDASPWWAAPLVMLGAIFAAAGWVSVKALASRERVLKGFVVLVIVLGVIGAPQYGLELLLVLAPPIALLAQAAGLIFRGR